MRYFAEVKEYLARHPEVKTVSFDLFDTLIFRKVYDQADVFELAGRKVLDSNASITAEEYKYIRKRAEILAREKREQETGSTEVTLKEIIENIPSWVKQGYDLEIAEFEVEKEVCFANPEVMDILAWCEQKSMPLFMFLICILLRSSYRESWRRWVFLLMNYLSLVHTVSANGVEDFMILSWRNLP